MLGTSGQSEVTLDSLLKTPFMDKELAPDTHKLQTAFRGTLGKRSCLWHYLQGRKTQPRAKSAAKVPRKQCFLLGSGDPQMSLPTQTVKYHADFSITGTSGG